MTEPERIAVLTDALEFAITVIRGYQMEIRNSEWVGVDLKQKGFCQGQAYATAIQIIREKAGMEMTRLDRADAEQFKNDD